MRTLGDPAYLERRARSQAATGVPLFAAGLVALTGGWWLFHFVPVPADWRSPLPLLGLVLTAVGAHLIADSWRLRRRLPGEMATLQGLAQQLDAAYTLLLNVHVPGLRGGVGAGSAMLVGPHGILVLLVKRLVGSFRLEGDRWWVLTEAGARPWDRSPTWEASRPVRALRRFVESEGLAGVPVRAAVIMGAEGSRVSVPKAGGAQASAAVLRPDEVAAYLRSLADAQGLDPGRVESVVKALAPFVQER